MAGHLTPHTAGWFKCLSAFDPVQAALTALFLGLLASHAPAQQITPVLIDDFTVPAPNVDQGQTQTSTFTINGNTNAQRTITASGTGSVEAITDGFGTFQVAGQQGTFVDLHYSNFTLNGPEQNILSLTFASTSNFAPLSFSLSSSSTTAYDIGESYIFPDSSTPHTYIIYLTTLSGYSPAFMAGVNNIDFLFGSLGSTYQLQLTNVSLVSEESLVPEPSVTFLFLVGGMGLIFLLRRRKLLTPDTGT
jgi:hypothetical protein